MSSTIKGIVTVQATVHHGEYYARCTAEGVTVADAVARIRAGKAVGCYAPASLDPSNKYAAKFLRDMDESGRADLGWVRYAVVDNLPGGWAPLGGELIRIG